MRLIQEGNSSLKVGKTRYGGERREKSEETRTARREKFAVNTEKAGRRAEEKRPCYWFTREDLGKKLKKTFSFAFMRAHPDWILASLFFSVLFYRRNGCVVLNQTC